MSPATRRRKLPPLLIAAGVALVILTARLAWVACQAESGWDTLAVHWGNATFGWLGAGHRPVQNRPPKEQAEFWLAEAEQILGENPESAELALGAAWVLDTPGRFGNRQAEDPFEAACRDSCLRLARRATELQPENRNWWRMRALLTFRNTHFGDLQPRVSNWAALLAEASRNDPENALYDYLAALQYWQASARLERSDGQRRIEILDPAGFQRGEEHFARASAKHLFAIGEHSLPAVIEFLGRSSLPRQDQADVAARRLLDLRGDQLVNRLCRWQQARADQLRIDSPHDAIRAWRTFLRIPQQIDVAAEPGAFSSNVQLERSIAMVGISALAKEHPGTIPDDELQRLDEEIASVQRGVTTTIRALSSRSPAFSDLLAGLVAAPRLNAALPLLAAGVLTLLLGAWLSQGRTAPPIRMSLLAHLSTLTIGFAIAAGVVAVLALDPLPRRDIGSWDTLEGMIVQASYVRRFALRWVTLPGPFLGSVLSLCLLGLWYVVRATDNEPRKCLRLFRGQSACLWGGLLICLGRPALALGGCLLVMYLLAAPAAVRLAETTYQQTIAPIRDPEAYWSSIEDKVAEIERKRG